MSVNNTKYSEIMSNNIYDKLIYSKGRITYHDYVTNKQDNVHNMLFDTALKKYMLDIHTGQDYETLKNQYRIIDIKREIYFEPSQVILIPKIIKGVVLENIEADLESYWNNEYIVKNVFLDYKVKPVANNYAEYSFTISDKHSTTDIKNACIDDGEIIEWDYVRGRAKLKSKKWGTEFYVDYKYINSDVKDNTALDDTTFTNLLKK